jgi:hypothetical protein
LDGDRYLRASPAAFFARVEGAQTKQRSMKAGTLCILCVMILVTTSGCAMASVPLLNNSIETNAVALGDLDGDGDLDGFLANGGSDTDFADTIWVNQGGAQAGQAGKFTASPQQLEKRNSQSIALGDLDGDDDLDAVVGIAGGFQVYLNRGGHQAGKAGSFMLHKRYDAPDRVFGMVNVLLSDLDGDGDLDVYAGICCGGFMSSDSQIWLNDGNANFTASEQQLGVQGSQAAALGDLDGDGDIDVFSANNSAVINAQGDLERNQPDRVWLNDGSGHFVDSGQRLGQFPSTAVALGDLDGDGDLDALVAMRGPALVWINDGSAQFRDSGQRLGDQRARSVWLGDLDGDGDLDAFINALEGSSIWLNNGDGTFSRSRQELDVPRYYATALGDLNGDGDLDLFAGFLNRDYKVWWNDGYGRLGTSWR